MLRWSLTFLLVALVAGALGLGGVAGTAAAIAKVLFLVAISLFVVTVIVGLAAGNSVANKVDHKTARREGHLLHK